MLTRRKWQQKGQQLLADSNHILPAESCCNKVASQTKPSDRQLSKARGTQDEKCMVARSEELSFAKASEQSIMKAISWTEEQLAMQAHLSWPVMYRNNACVPHPRSPQLAMLKRFHAANWDHHNQAMLTLGLRTKKSSNNGLALVDYT